MVQRAGECFNPQAFPEFMHAMPESLVIHGSTEWLSASFFRRHGAVLCSAVQSSSPTSTLAVSDQSCCLSRQLEAEQGVTWLDNMLARGGRGLQRVLAHDYKQAPD